MKRNGKCWQKINLAKKNISKKSKLIEKTYVDLHILLSSSAVLLSNFLILAPSNGYFTICLQALIPIIFICPKHTKFGKEITSLTFINHLWSLFASSQVILLFDYYLQVPLMLFQGSFLMQQ